MTKIAAEWRLERGSSVLLLEELNHSSTLLKTVLTQVRLRMLSICGLLLILIWAFSPVGGQSPLNILSTTTTLTASKQPLQYAYLTPGVAFSGTASSDTYGGFVESLYVTSLLAAPTTVQNSMDNFNNLRLPTLKGLRNQANSTGWVTIPQTRNVTYSSLIGVPITGINVLGNTSFLMDGSYYDLTFNGSSGGDLVLNGSGISVNITMNDVFTKFGVILSAAGRSAQMSFTWDQVNVQCQVVCTVIIPYGNQHSCTVKAMRQLNVTSPLVPDFMIASNIETRWNSLLSGQNFSLSEAFLRHPQAPLQANLSDPSTASPSVDDLTIRLSQLLNTYLYGGADPLAMLSGVPSPATVMNATGTCVSVHQRVYAVDSAWLGVFAVANTIFLLCGLTTAVLDSFRLNPDILGYVSSMLRWPSLSLDMPAVSSTLGGEEKTMLIKDTVVRLGDVQGDMPLGRLAIGTLDKVQRIRPGRSYE